MFFWGTFNSGSLPWHERALGFYKSGFCKIYEKLFFNKIILLIKLFLKKEKQKGENDEKRKIGQLSFCKR